MAWQIWVPVGNAILIVLVGFIAFMMRRSIFGEIDRLRGEYRSMEKTFDLDLQRFQKDLDSRMMLLREIPSCDLLRQGCQGLLLEKFVNLQKAFDALAHGQQSIVNKIDELVKQFHALEINQSRRP